MTDSSKQASPVITQDPLNVFRFENEWNVGIFDCCEDCRLAMCSYFCWLYMFCTLMSDLKESCCSYICIPFPLIVFRTKMRMDNIKSMEKAIPKPTIPVNDGRLPQELFEIIQIPPDENPFKYENLWETELCDFFEDCNEFIFAHCCYYCYIYKIFKTVDENIFSYICTPNPLIPIRTKIRAVLRIKGSLIEDCCQVIFCAPCTAFQINQELKYKEIIPDK